MQNKRRSRSAFPNVVDEKLAAFLGYLTGDGHISEVKRIIGLTTGDESQADHFARLTRGIVRHHAAQEMGRDRSGASCSVPRTSQDFLKHLGLKTGVLRPVERRARCHSPLAEVGRGGVPAGLLRLRRLRGQGGVILSTSSTEMSKTVQLLLLNFGILSTPPPAQGRLLARPDDGQVRATSFSRRSASACSASRRPCERTSTGTSWFKEETWEDEIVAIERGRADVYDISVEETHRYAAQGFINHNSYWHSHDHDPEGPAPFRGHRLRRPPLRHHGHLARPAQPLQAGHRAAARHRASLEHRASSARSTTSATTWRSGATGTSSSAWDGRKSSRSAASTTTSPSSTRS